MAILPIPPIPSRPSFWPFQWQNKWPKAAAKCRPTKHIEMDIQREDIRPEFNCCAVAHEDPLPVPPFPLPHPVNYGLWTLNVITQQQSKRETGSAAGEAGKSRKIGENRGKGKAGETTSQAKHEIKMRLRCILNCHDADDDGDARSRPGKGVAAPARRSAYNFIFHTQLSLTKCEGRGPKAAFFLAFCLCILLPTESVARMTKDLYRE